MRRSFFILLSDYYITATVPSAAALLIIHVRSFLFFIPSIKIFFHGVGSVLAAITVTTRETVPIFPAVSVAV